jgi:uncharacterized protein (TIGR03435 family)
MSPLIDVAGWTLVHFVWQGAIIALLAGAALRLLRSASSQTRYVVGCAALAAMLASPIITVRLITASEPTATAIEASRSAPAANVAAATSALRAFVVPATDTLERRSQHTGFDAFLPVAVTMWLVGVAFLLVRLAGGWWHVRRLHRTSLAMTASRWQAASERIASHLHLGCGVHVVDSPLVDTPAAIGWLRPVIVLPIAALANLAPAQVNAILAHELAHIRRHDFIVNLLQTVAETLLFYHPAVWWVSARIRTEREHCCDEVAVEVCGDAAGYAAALAELETWRTGRTTLALAATGGSLLERVRRLLGVSSDDAPRSFSGMTMAAALVVLFLVVVRVQYLPAAQPPPTGADAGNRRGFGPRDLNKFLGFELLPGPPHYPTDDPRGAVAWQVAIEHPSGRMAFHGFTGRGLIRYAYDLRDSPVVDGPSWIDTQSFELTATTEVALTEDETRAALRRFLEDRFKLVAHHATRDFPVYALVKTNVAGAPGPNLRRSTSDCDDAEALRAASAAGAALRGSNTRSDIAGPFRRRSGSLLFCGVENSIHGLLADKVTMAELARGMKQHLSPMVNREIVDRTGLAGTFDVTLNLGLLPAAAVLTRHPAAGLLLEPLGVHSIFTALPVQLGLRLDDATATYDVLVIDHAEKPF